MKKTRRSTKTRTARRSTMRTNPTSPAPKTGKDDGASYGELFDWGKTRSR